MQKTKQKNHSLSTILATAGLVVLLAISFLGFFAAAWYVRVYGRIGFDSIIFTLTSSLGGVDQGLIKDFMLCAALPTVLCTAIVSLLLFWGGKPLTIRGKKLLPMKRTVSAVISLALSLCLLIHGAFKSQLVSYVVAIFSESELYETEYRDPQEVAITFPEEKRNLIYIMLESMETSYQDTSLGGALEYNLIPELTQLSVSSSISVK